MIRGALTAGALVAALNAAAQSYPTRAIRVMIPYPPGGGSDMLIRPIAARVSESIGQQLIMDNRPGGGSIIGTQLAAKSTPDGYTALIVDLAFYSNPSLVSKLPYDSVRDFAPVVSLASSASVLVVHSSVPAKNLKQLIALAKARPGELHYSSGGNGTSTHLAGELLKNAAGINLIHVPYKGVALALTDTLAGQITITFAGVNAIRGFVETGKLRALGITGAVRKAAVSKVPTFAESGLPGFEASIWQGIFVPARTPPEMIARLNREIVAVLNANDIKEQLRVQGLDSLPSTPEQFGAFVRDEIAKWAKVIKISGAKAE